jgi:nanoRNase/pAp phosphatase (c-di-AMP/oligoRNAs hydrolase)
MINLEKQIFKQLGKANDILIVFLNNKDGDALAASLGLFIFLNNIGKKVTLVSSSDSQQKSTNHKNNLNFLPFFKKIESELSNLRRFIVSLDIKNAKISQIKYSLDEDKLNFIISPASGWFSADDISSRADEFKHDLIITIGVNDLEFLGEIYDNNIEFFYKTTIINIDNSPANEEFGQINFIDLNSVTNSEIIYYLLKNYEAKQISDDVATCILAGIIKKTKNFKSGNLSPKTLLASSELIALGARREEIIKNLFYSKSISSLKLWGEVLKYLKSESAGEFLWSKIGPEYLAEFSPESESLEEIIDELISSLPKAKIFVLLTTNEGRIDIKAFSLKGVNCLDLLKDYSAEGNYFFAEGFLDNQEKSNKSKTSVFETDNALSQKAIEEDLIKNLKNSFNKQSS